MTHADTEVIAAWFGERVPPEWFSAKPDMSVDREEIVVVGDLGPLDAADPKPTESSDDGDAKQAAAAEARVARFREETRAARMRIADEAEYRFGRKVAWGATAAGRTYLFTTISVPVMTRLRQAERRVLDTLVDSGVARSRSDALSWCVKLVGANESEWIDRLRESLVHVQKVRAEGPSATS